MIIDDNSNFYLNGENFLICEDCDSEDEFETIEILFGDKWLSIDPETYITVGGIDSLRNACMALIIGIDESVFGDGVMLLGDTFLRNYYIYHDMDNRELGFSGIVRNENTDEKGKIDFAFVSRVSALRKIQQNKMQFIFNCPIYSQLL